MSDLDLSLAAAERIDAACDRFEADWLAGNSPRIEDHLAAAEPSIRGALESALRAVEAELRGRSVADTSVSRSSTDDQAGRTGNWKQSDEPIPAHVGRFEVVGVLGAGAFGRVYRARDPDIGRTVAIKVPLVRLVESTAERDRFLREARAAATVNHPNVCQIYEVGEEAGRPYIVMAHVPGRSLAELLKGRTEPLPQSQSAQIVRKIARALAAAHDRGVVHRDLKPANVMIDTDRRDLVVMDFGLARAPQPENADATRSGVVMGTPAYMSPEQARGDSRQIGPTADIFSLGVIFYELLTGTRPFVGTATEVLGQLLHVDPDPPSHRRPDVDPRLEEVCLKAMAKDPAARFGSMREFAAAIDAAVKQLSSADTSRAVETSLNTEVTPGDRVETDAALHTVFRDSELNARDPETRSRMRWVGGLSLALLLVAVPLGYIYGLAIIRIVTNTGELVIETDARDIEITVRGESAVVHDKAKNRRYVLTAGEYDVEVREVGDSGIRFATKHFTIVRGGKETFHARLELPPKPAIPRSGDPDARTDELDRELAEHLFRLGIRSVEIAVGNGPPIRARSRRDLPTEPFHVRHFDSWGISDLNDETVEPVLRWIERRDVNYISFHGNPIGDTTVRKLVRLPSLKRLYLGATKITPTILPDIAARTDLTELGLYERPFTDADIAVISGLTALEKLSIQHTSVTDAGVRHLRGMTRLKVLNVHSCAVTKASLGHLRGLPVELLDLSQTQVRGAEGLAELTGLPNLQEVHLNGLGLQDDDLKPLSECGQLTKLFLANNHLTDAGLAHLARMKRLTVLHLTAGDDDTNRFTPAGLRSLQAALPGCMLTPKPGPAAPTTPPAVGVTPAELRDAVAWGIEVGGRVYVSINGQEMKLSRNDNSTVPVDPFEILGLDLAERKEVTDDGLKHVRNLNQINTLTLNGTSVTDAGTPHLRGLTGLRNLNFFNARISDDGLDPIVALPNLEFLGLHGNPITDAGVKKIVRLPHLFRLELSNTQITDDALKHLASVRRLRILGLEGTRVTRDAVVAFQSALPACRIITDFGKFEPLKHPDRDVAEWVFRQGGSVRIKPVNGVERLAKHDGELTPGAFRVRGFFIDKPIPLDKSGFDLLDRLDWLDDFGIEHDDLTDADVIRLGQMPRAKAVTAVNFHGRKLTDIGLESLADWPALTGINFGRTAATGARLDKLRSLSLKKLSLHDCPITDDTLAHFTRFPDLHYVMLDRTPVTDAGMVHLTRLPKLDGLVLNQTTVTDAGLRILLDCSKTLDRLYLVGSQVTPEGAAAFREVRPLVELHTSPD